MLKRQDNDLRLKDMLVKGEKLIAHSRIHGAIYWKGVAVVIFALLLTFQVSTLGGFFVLVAGLMLAYAAAMQSILMVAVSNKRLFARYGLLQVEVVDIQFDKVESIELERMLPGYIFGYSNVVVMGTGNRYIRIPFVANGPEIRRAYNEQVMGGGAQSGES